MAEQEAVAKTEAFEFTLEGRSLSFAIDENLYPRDAIYGAAYLFVDRCWLFLTRPAEGFVGVRLKCKTACDEAALEALAGEFANELLNQVLRQRIGAATRDLRDYYMARAFSIDDTRASIDALLAELDAEDLAEDDLEVKVPWETEAPDKGSSGG